MYPLRPCPKVAVLCASLRLSTPAFRLDGPVLPDLEALKAATIAAPATVLASARFQGWQPTHPVVAFTGVHHGFLYDFLRNRIWAEMGVPVFEHLLDTDGHVIARECDAHNGLHLVGDLRQSLIGRNLYLDGRNTGLTARVVTGLCGCGKTGSRLLDVRLARLTLPEAAEASRVPLPV